jgi:hypothetical protein
MSVPASGREPFPEEIHRVVCAAARQRRPMAARYDRTRRLLCNPHVVGYNQPGEFRVFCYQYAGETKSGPLSADGKGIRRCLSLKKPSKMELLDSPCQTEPTLVNAVWTMSR